MGKYSAANAFTCSNCGAGYYASATSSPACDFCDAGKYSGSSATSCVECPSGRYGSITASAYCSLCPAGKYSGDAANGCTKCAVGKQNPAEEAASCVSCASGRYASAMGTVTCFACPGGKYQDAQTATNCKPCAAGYYAIGPANVTCSLCPGGRTSSGGASECDNDCPAGTYLDSNQCNDCGPGWFSLKAEEYCIACERGRYAAAYATPNGCALCPAGYYAASAQESGYVTCPAGKYSGSGAYQCESCLAGYFSTAGSASCDGTCQAGTYSPAGSFQCYNCGAGRYSNTGSGGCSLCECGRYTAAGDPTCTLCAAGRVNGGNNRITCDACPSGWYQPSAGACGCGECQRGTYSAGSGNLGCSNCDAGKYSERHQASCISCLQGWYAPVPGSTDCTVCAEGRYAEVIAASECPICPAGTISFTASDSCTNCPPGTYSDPEASLCLYCNNGKYSPGSGSPECLSCEEGKFSTVDGAFSECTECPKGHYAPLTQSTSCTECEPGRYAAETAESDCSICSEGFYCVAGATKNKEYSCANLTEQRPAAFFCPEGSSKRTLVPEGFFSLPLTEISLRNRVDVEKCSKTKTCIDGVQYSNFFWFTGECSESLTELGEPSNAAHATVIVDEGTDGLPVGSFQRVVSPFPVEFTMDPASKYQNGGNFRLVEKGNSSIQIHVHRTGGLDFETVNIYHIGIVASSNGSSINCTMRVDVNDVNEMPQILLGTPPRRNVSEAAITNEYLTGGAVQADDPDTSDEHVFRIKDSVPMEGMDYFGIGGCSGRLYVGEEGLDVLVQPQYNLTVCAKDDAKEPLEDCGNITLDVLNANDPPSFKLPASEIGCELPENSPINTSVTGKNCSGGVPWYDPDVSFGDYVVWTISRADAENTFDIDPATGELRSRHDSLDFEDQNRYNIEVTITDTGGLKASISLNIYLLNVNEAPESHYPSLYVLESVGPDTVICTAAQVTTNDVDSEIFTYTMIEDGNSSAFNISKSSGALVVGQSGLDYESKPTYQIRVVTTDAGLDDMGGDRLSSMTVVYVTVLDVNEQPALSVADSYHVDEDAPLGSLVGYVYVADPDVGQSHSFVLSRADSSYVTIGNADSDEGSALGKGSIIVGASLDYETMPVLFMNVTTSDGSLSDMKQITVFVNNSNDAPVCPGILMVTIPEGQTGLLYPASSLANAFTWNFTDQDAYDTKNRWGQFEVSTDSSSSGGFLDVTATCASAGCPDRAASLTLNTILDFETTPTITFTAVATDGGGDSCSTEVQIDVINVNDPPYFPTRNATFFVPELATDGYALGLVGAIDPDSSATSFGQITYTLYRPAECPNQPNGSAVSVDVAGTIGVTASSGQVFVADSGGILFPGQICTGVRVTDGDGLSANGTLTVVTVDQNSPPALVATHRKIRLPENMPSFSNLTKILGSDPDDDGLEYSIVACSALYFPRGGAPNGTLPCGPRAAMFGVTPIAGDPLITNAWFSLDASQLDYEDSAIFGPYRPPTFELTVEVKDVPRAGLSVLSTSTTITVIVSDVPEAPTFLGTSFAVLESAPEGTVVGSVAGFAADQDGGASLEFSLEREFTFADAMTYDSCLSECKGRGLQTVCLSDESAQANLLKAYANHSSLPANPTANGNSNSTDPPAWVWIGLRESEDVNTPWHGEYLWEPPGCASSLDNWVPGQPTSSASKSCASLGVQAEQWVDNPCSSRPGEGLTECVCEVGPFAISADGAVTTTGTLDFERLKRYTLTAVVTDDTGLATAANVEINVVNVNEAPVIFGNQVFTVEENTGRGLVVGTVLAYDDDTDDDIEYTLLNGTHLFSIQQEEGALLVGGDDISASIDFECVNRFVLLVRATSGEMFVERTVEVLVEDVNDLSVSGVQFGGGLATLGGGTVTLIGTNFGPCGGASNGAVAVRATYSNYLDGLVYEATGCSTDNSTNTVITCRAAPGVGSEHFWNVTVDSRGAVFEGGLPASRVWSTTSSDFAYSNYRTPTVTAVGAAGSEMPTQDGGAPVTLVGTDFPPFACASAAACGGTSSMAWQLSTPSLAVAITWEDSGWGSVDGSASSSGGSFLSMRCLSLAVTVGGTEAECVVGPGVGSGLNWGVTVGASAVPSVALSSGLLPFLETGFASPEVTFLLPASSASDDSGGDDDRNNVHSLSTSGGETVVLKGLNLGGEYETLASSIGVTGLRAPGLVVTYGPAGSVGMNADPFDGGAAKYSAAECVVVLEHFEIACTTVPGVGANLTWRVGIAGQWGSSQCVNGVDPASATNYSNCLRNATTSYASPQVQPSSEAFGSGGGSGGGKKENAVAGAGLSGATTVGGQLLVISGVEFGPSAGEAVPVVTYGPTPLEVGKYGAEECEVSVDYSQLRCLTSPGVGKNHWLQVSVGGQLSNTYEANISYSPPNVAEYFEEWSASASGLDEGARTEGGQWIVISGRNFGTAAEDAVTQVRYQVAGDDGGGGSSFSNEVFYPCKPVVDPLSGKASLNRYYDCPAADTNHTAAATCLVLTGVVDGPLIAGGGGGDGGPKALELYAACEIGDLSSYGLGKVSAKNAAHGPSFTFPAAQVAPGTFLQVAYSQSDFVDFFGFAPTYSGAAVADVNGDEGDALLLFNQGSVVDVLGSLNTSSSAATAGLWAYGDGWMYRRNGTAPSSEVETQEGVDWSLGHENVLDGYTSNADALIAGVGFPLGTYSPLPNGGTGGGWEPIAGCALIDPCPCHVVTDHVAINCSTVPGAGAGHAWVVSVAEQESTAATTSYGVPSVLALSGPGAYNASTYGNQAVTISGVNFGPQSGGGESGDSSFLDSVTYGPGGTEYEAANCQVTQAHVEVVCLTIPGVGSTLRWVVTVAQQESLPSSSTTGYARPQLLGVFPTRLDTQGGARHVVNGTHLGMASQDTYLQVLLDGVALAVDGGSAVTIYPATSVFMTSKARTAASGAEGYWEAIEVVMPPLEDEDHAKDVVVSVGHRRFGGAKADSNAVGALYKPPMLFEVQNSPGTAEGTQQVTNLMLLGANFGSVGTVFLDGAGVEAGRIDKWRDDQITLSVVADSGNITVVVGAYSSDKLRFDDFSPILYTSLSSEYLPDLEGYRTDAKVDSLAVYPSPRYPTYASYVASVNAGGPGHRNLSLAGIYFGTLEDVIEITIGDTPNVADCPIIKGSLTELPILSLETIRSITCRLPPGAGLLNRVVLSRSAKSSFVTNSSQQLYVDYHPPTVTGVEPRRVHTVGGNVVTISGRDFGAAGRVGVYYGDSVRLKVLSEGFSATSMQVLIPEGDGLALPLTVSVATQQDTVYGSLEEANEAGEDVTDPGLVLGFKYYAPNVSSVLVPSGGLSTLGGFVTLTGSDLGRPGRLRASLVRAVESRRRGLLSFSTNAVGELESSDSSEDLLLFPDEEEAVKQDHHQRQLSAQSLDDDAYVESEWEELDFSVAVLNSTHVMALIQIGQGEGVNSLLVNVSGQVSLAPLAYAAPVLTSVNPASSPTQGGVNVTLQGVNLGVGSVFELALTGPPPTTGGGAGAQYCNHVWTQADLGVSVFAYSHSKLWFLTPEGQCDAPMELTLTVAGQPSNALSFRFDPPTISMLSLDGSSGGTPLGEDCARSSSKGCSLETAGGYVVTVTGTNFGVDLQTLLFRGAPLESFSFVSHTEATFEVPAGTGAGIHVTAQVGSRSSSPSYFSYDPPWVTSFTPNEFDSNDDLIEIYGRNFGESVEAAGDDIRITIGNRTCGPVSVGASETTLWQSTVTGVPYLWCHLSGSTVGRKSLELFVAGQNLTRDAENSGIRGVCQSGFYGQPAWTVFTSADVECEMPCQDDKLAQGKGEGAEDCTAFFDREVGRYRLQEPFTEQSEACQDEWSCMRNQELPTGQRSNCTILSRQDEFCVACPLGSSCDDFTTLYSVEPISVEGYWRDAVKEGDPHYPQFRCEPKRTHRPYCWDFQPCSPPEACAGSNTCSKGYTLNKCAQCCDVRLGKLPDGGGKNPDCFDEEGEQLLYHRMYGKCEKCPENMLFLVVGALSFLLVAGLTGRRMQKKKVDLAIFSIGVDYFQVLAIFASTEVVWPESVQFLFRIASLFNFSINLTPPECAFSVTYRTKWLVMEFFPTFLFFSIACLYGFALLYFRFCDSRGRKRVRLLRNNIIAAALLVMYVLYLNISENTLDPINCRKILAEDGSKSDRQFMVSQPDEVCWETKFPTLQQELAPYAFTFFVVYTLGYPCLISYILLNPKNRTKCMNDQYLRCMGTGSKQETNKAHFNHRTKFATLYFKFKPQYYFWILLIVLRKLCIVTFTLLFHVNATMQLSMILLVMFVSYTLQIKYMPYLSRADYHGILGDMDEDHYQGLVGPYGSCPQPKGIGYEVMLEEKELEATVTDAGMRNSTGGSGGRGLRRLTMADVKSGWGDRFSKGDRMFLTSEELKVVGNEALKALFNYNTVEAVLLFCAILVCLFGIMFASEFTGPGDPLYERLGELTLAVIGTSLAYYFLVVWTEVVAVMFPSLELSFVSGAVEGKRDQVKLDEDGNVEKSSGDSEGDDGVDDDEDELNAEAASRGLDGDDRDEWVLRQLEKECDFEFDVNPIVVAELEAEAQARGLTLADVTGGKLGSEQDRASTVATLLTLPEQVELQETVARLHAELQAAKKKAAQGAAMEVPSSSLGGGGNQRAQQKKKKKNKIGGGGHVDTSLRGGGGGGVRSGVGVVDVDDAYGGGRGVNGRDDKDAYLFKSSGGESEGRVLNGKSSATGPAKEAAFKSKAVRKSVALSSAAGGPMVGCGGGGRGDNSGGRGGGGGSGRSGGLFKEKKTMRQSILERGRAPTLSHNLGFEDMGYGGGGGGGGGYGGGGGGESSGSVDSSDSFGLVKDKRKSMVQTFANPMQGLKNGTARKEKLPQKSLVGVMNEFGDDSGGSSGNGGGGGGGGVQRGRGVSFAAPSFQAGSGRGFAETAKKRGLKKLSAFPSVKEEGAWKSSAKMSGMGGGCGCGAGVVPKQGGGGIGYALKGRAEASKTKKTQQKAAKLAVADFEREDAL